MLALRHTLAIATLALHGSLITAAFFLACRHGLVSASRWMPVFTPVILLSSLRVGAAVIQMAAWQGNATVYAALDMVVLGPILLATLGLTYRTYTMAAVNLRTTTCLLLPLSTATLAAVSITVYGSFKVLIALALTNGNNVGFVSPSALSALSTPQTILRIGTTLICTILAFHTILTTLSLTLSRYSICIRNDPIARAIAVVQLAAIPFLAARFSWATLSAYTHIGGADMPINVDFLSWFDAVRAVWIHFGMVVVTEVCVGILFIGVCFLAEYWEERERQWEKGLAISWPLESGREGMFMGRSYASWMGERERDRHRDIESTMGLSVVTMPLPLFSGRLGRGRESMPAFPAMTMMAPDPREVRRYTSSSWYSATEGGRAVSRDRDGRRRMSMDSEDEEGGWLAKTGSRKKGVKRTWSKSLVIG